MYLLRRVWEVSENISIVKCMKSHSSVTAYDFYHSGITLKCPLAELIVEPTIQLNTFYR